MRCVVETANVVRHQVHNTTSSSMIGAHLAQSQELQTEEHVIFEVVTAVTLRLVVLRTYRRIPFKALSQRSYAQIHVFLFTCFFLLYVTRQPPVGHGLLIYKVSISHTTTHHSRQDSSGRMISAPQRPLADNTQHSQQTDIHVPTGIRTHSLSRRSAADLRLRPRGHWDRLFRTLKTKINKHYTVYQGYTKPWRRAVQQPKFLYGGV